MKNFAERMKRPPFTTFERRVYPPTRRGNVREALARAELPTRETLPDYFASPALDRRHQTFKDSSYFAAKNSDYQTPDTGTAIELARWACLDGQLGIIKGYWQWISGEASDMPMWATRPLFLHESIGVKNRWFIRLSQLNKTDSLGPLWRGLSSAIPGLPYSECDNYVMNQIKFPWGLPESGVFWRVPPGFSVRVFYALDEISAGQTGIINVGARLWGYTQSIETQEAMQNSRMGWT